VSRYFLQVLFIQYVGFPGPEPWWSYFIFKFLLIIHEDIHNLKFLNNLLLLVSLRLLVHSTHCCLRCVPPYSSWRHHHSPSCSCCRPFHSWDSCWSWRKLWSWCPHYCLLSLLKLVSVLFPASLLRMSGTYTLLLGFLLMLAQTLVLVSPLPLAFPAQARVSTILSIPSISGTYTIAGIPAVPLMLFSAVKWIGACSEDAVYEGWEPGWISWKGDG
jgi:hypothetical protein